ncbi:S8 family serine peptidase [Winogradskyella sp. DF17]|uniref:S8 family serine peptidase n=1 Tax=Winogradskyella pelagia TaxID=2819984 RepID=A0ABS3T4J8_9FLAO|nr:S8 family serine peptidase [Winogradskyella sp. DF17]MBO3117660.1 S8 family serine peptidase [Winogradskyella sp. DF17]
MITTLRQIFSKIRFRFFILFTILLFSVFSLTAQNDNQIVFQGELITMPNNIETFQWNQMPQTAFFNDGYYGWLQFDETPTLAIQNDFKTKGLELIEYIPHRAYLFYFPASTSIDYLKVSGVKSIIPVSTSLKQVSEIKEDLIGDWAIDNDKVLVNVQYHDKVDANVVIAEISRVPGLSIIENYKTSNIMQVSVAKANINQLAEIPFIKWIELIPAPDVKEDDGGRSLHRSSNLDTQTLSGRNYTGEGVGVIVRDDGVVGPHIDFQGRINNSQAAGSGNTHGDGVAGILAGAGNLDPTKRGMAAGAEVYVTNYASSFLDTATIGFIDSGAAQITNSSYGNGCNAGYTTVAQTVDAQTNTNVSLLHVFSAGNSNGNDCGYGAGGQWGNITGGHKQGKNVIATANVFANGGLVSSSSRGPAYDGRIKPDITAHGQGQLSTDENNGYLSFGGTSGAAPGIAGVSAQLYQAYMELNGGAMPESALIKAALLNTANDYGNVGPDFKFGWGLVNGLRAVKLLEDNRYLDDNISQGNTNNHSITIPADTKQVRFMLYWNDPAAAPGASTALVNDLDLKVTDPSSNQRLPWVLNTTPSSFLLDFPASFGEDRLNNMEQVLINDPQAGNYNIEISGFNIPAGVQHYYVVYEVLTENLVVTYPSGGEKFEAGNVEVIHWDLLNSGVGNTTVEYSIDNGANWTTIGSVSGDVTNINWFTPSVASGECLIRVSNGSDSYTSDNPFSISPIVTGVNVDQICPDEMTVNWNAISGATSYDVYLLGEKFMEVAGTSNTNSAAISITDPNQEFWVAVVAKGANGWESRRSIAINQSGGLLNCVLNNDVLVESLNNDLDNLQLVCSDDTSIVVSANVRNSGQNDQTQGFLISYQLDSEPIVQENFTETLTSGAQAIYEFTTPLELTTDGDHVLKVWTTLPGDEFLANDDLEEAFSLQLNPVALNLIEDFDTNGVPPPGWKIENVDNGITWEAATGLGADGQATTAAYINNYNYNNQGGLDILETVVYDLGGTDLVLNFDLAKAQYSASLNDGLRVEISTDCGVTFIPIYEKDDLELSTVDNYVGSLWGPSSASDWRTESIDLSAFEGSGEAVFKFVNINGYGNSTIIDNINVAGTLSINDNQFNTGLVLYPNPADNNFTVKVNNQFIETVTIYDLFGKEVAVIKANSNNQELNVNSSNLVSGMYLVGVKTDSGNAFKKLVVK